MAGIEREYQEFTEDELVSAVDQLEYSLTVLPPQYEDIEYGGYGLGPAGEQVMEATLRSRKGIEINISASEGILWPDPPNSTYEDEARGIMRDLAEQLELDESLNQGAEYRWTDFAGYPEVRREVKERVCWYLKRPEWFEEELGLSAPRVLLHGPPGTGKTLLGKIVAEQADAEFYNVTPAEYIDSGIGDSEENIRNLFEEARENSPSLLFFDEIGSFAREREEQTTDTGKSIVETLLTTLDGIEDYQGVAAMGTTNRLESLDGAFTRSGRFDTQLEIPEPDEESREEILKVHLNGNPCGVPAFEDIKYERLARETEGFVGADIERLAEEAVRMNLSELMRDGELNHINQANFKEHGDDLTVDTQDVIDAKSRVPVD